MRGLFRSSWRHLHRHPWQAVLSVLGVALGVAVVVAIDLSNQSAARAFELSTEAVAGRATHQIVGGPSGVPEQVYTTLRLEAGVREAAPIVESDLIAPAYPGRAFRLLGVDPFAEEPFRPYLGALGQGVEVDRLLARSGAVLLSATTASEMGLGPGSGFEVFVGGRTRTLTLAGVLDPEDGVSRQALEGLIVADIATAQELLGAVGRLDRVDLIVPVGPAGDAILERVDAGLPVDLSLVRAEARAGTVEQMTRAFRINLTALSLLALVFGMFLIYNSMTFSVVQRRTEIGTLRALGVTRGEVLGKVLFEALLIGVIGTVVGIGLGIRLADGLLELVTRTINDLYFAVTVREVAVPPLALVKGVVLGVGATLAAAAAPALEAASSPPRATLTRSYLEARARAAAPRLAAIGTGLAGAGAVLLVAGEMAGAPWDGVGAGFVALFAIVIGLALTTPWATVLLAAALRPVLTRALGLVGGMASRGVVTTLSRTAPAVAALVIAVSVTIGLGVMIGSFRGSVERWLGQTLQADVYVSAPTVDARQADAVLEPVLMDRLLAAPGVSGASVYRNVVLESDEGRTRVMAVDLDPRGRDAFDLLRGDPSRAWTAFESGEAALVSEPFAYRAGVGPGDVVRLRSGHGDVEIPVAGVYLDYGSDQGVVAMSRALYARLWDDDAVSSLAFFAEPGVEAERLVERLREAAGAGAHVVIRSNRGLREASLAVFDRTFLITGVLRGLAFVVAFIGILSALMALQLERAREFGVLRASGLTPGQLWKLVTTQTAVTGFIAGVLAIPLGLVLAAVMVFVINRRSFGWTLQMEVPPETLGYAVILALVASLLAGLYPAWKMARTSPALALREEG